MVLTLDSLAERISVASNAEELVGPNDDGRKHRVGEIFRAIHPDKYSAATDITKANNALKRLNELLDEETRAAEIRNEISTKRNTFYINGLGHKGRIANLYNATYLKDGALDTAYLKMPRSPKDSDLLTAEARSLKKIHTLDDKRKNFIPLLVESFRHRDTKTGVERVTNVLQTIPGFISLTDIHRAYPNGLDSRDLSWMWRRAFIALSIAHEAGIVHGAVVPEHILIHPEKHGLILCGWGASVERGETIKLLNGPRQFYPPEVLNKERTSRSTDIYMLSKSMEYLLEPNAPRQFHSFIRGCTFARPAVRPKDAMSLLHEFDDMIERLFGPRTFRPFSVPSVTI
jgi:serine/threonine protein kinase